MNLLKLWPWKSKPVVSEAKKDTPTGDELSTNLSRYRRMKSENLLSWINDSMFQKTHADLRPLNSEGVATDSKTKLSHAMDASTKAAFSLSSSTLSPALFAWYVRQGFIGYQACAIIAQNWLVDKACTVSAQDAIKKGYEITVNDGSNIDPEIIADMRGHDDAFKINENLIEFERSSRIFGIRIALFKVDSKEKDYYTKPFNIDGVTKGSYKGIVQVDPYWITPELDEDAVSNPASMRFYEPTWWRINGQLYHHTHLIITRFAEVPDTLKPSYIYGGLSLTQLIYERVYAAERTANEAPMLALTKRVNVLKADMKKALANQAAFEERIAVVNDMRDNYGIFAIGIDEEYQQTDTALADLDVTIMTQYQLVAAIARVPASKLLETSPKGFNATGGFEESSYYDSLEGIQKYKYTPFLNRHYELLIRSEIMPKHGIKEFKPCINWTPLDSLTEKEVAEINEINSRTDAQLVNSGAISATESRDRIIEDDSSGHNGLEAYDEPEDEPDDGLTPTPLNFNKPGAI